MDQAPGSQQRLAELEYLASHDVLTGLDNRSAFDEELATVIANLDARSTVAILIVDLDGFKTVNDTFGHDRGDEVLVSAAHRLVDALPAGTSMARLGGDEFGVILPGLTSSHEAMSMAAAICDAFRRPLAGLGQAYSPTASVGIRLSASQNVDPRTLLSDADLALYSAKHNGRNRIAVFRPLVDDVSLEDDLRTKLDAGEIVMHYLPILSLETASVWGVEALIRLPHADSLIPPNEFIPLAERVGLIGQLGELAVQRSCLDLAAVRAATSLDLHLTVNLSPIQLSDPLVPEMVERALRSAALPPSVVTLELTESTDLDRIPYAAETARALRDIGVGLAVDDFGTGHSSLSLLRQLPITMLKIEKAFAEQLPNSALDRAIVSNVLDLGHRLDLPVVVEGVETMAQSDALVELGGDLVQGFLYSEPLPPDALIIELPSMPERTQSSANGVRKRA